MSEGAFTARPPPLAFERAACPRCGAETVEEAGDRCRPSSDETGEYWCPSGEREDAQGYLLQPTAASIAAQDDWYAARAPEGDA